MLLLLLLFFVRVQSLFDEDCFLFSLSAQLKNDCWFSASLLLYRYLQFLPVPELMPFRLTRQFVNLMLPLKESGTLKNVMVHTLRALRNNHELLLNTMDVFIKEPSLDWQVRFLSINSKLF